jgi:hypothetical protein
LTEKNSRRGRNPGLFVLSADTRKMNLKNILDRNSIKKIMKKIHIPQPLPMENKISNRIIRETHQVYIKPRLEKGHGRDPRRFPNINKNPLRNGPTSTFLKHFPNLRRLRIYINIEKRNIIRKIFTTKSFNLQKRLLGNQFPS